MKERPVVVGCGIAGIAAAAALRRSFGEVVIVEKDVLPVAPAPRRGIPQAQQLHNLLTSAQVHLEQLLPGFLDAIVEAGAGDARVSTETHVWELAQRMPERDLGLRLMCAPRPVIEHVARSLLLDLGGVLLQQDTRASGLEAGPNGAVSGLRIVAGGRETTLRTSLVVDASGSQSAARRWLRTLGASVPRVDSARVAQWYVSAVFERPPRYAGSNEFWLVFPTPPLTRGGLVSPAAPDLWYVSLSGRESDNPPANPAEMQTYAATLEAPWIGELLRSARPLGEAHLFRRPIVRWRRYDLLSQPLPGFVPLGDSIATLNPLLGQGMSVAAEQATVLASLLDVSPEEELSRRYLSRAAEACRAAWRLGGLLEPGIPGDDAQHLEPASFPALGALLAEDPALHRRYVGVWHLIEPAATLADPALAARVMARSAAPISLVQPEGSSPS